MVHRLVLRPGALAEIDEAAAWYEDQREGLGREFVGAVSSSIEAIKRTPLQYQKVFKDRRRAIVARFRFNLIYVVRDNEIVILACLHGRRDPQRWRART
jgi:plasmid stabilization system protein ParE